MFIRRELAEERYRMVISVYILCLSATLRFAIQNFVFPFRWLKIDRQMAGEPRLIFTLGIHPHVLANNRPEE